LNNREKSKLALTKSLKKIGSCNSA